VTVDTLLSGNLTGIYIRVFILLKYQRTLVERKLRLDAGKSNHEASFKDERVHTASDYRNSLHGVRSMAAVPFLMVAIDPGGLLDGSSLYDRPDIYQKQEEDTLRAPGHILGAILSDTDFPRVHRQHLG
jgi:hypothetical protein